MLPIPSARMQRLLSKADSDTLVTRSVWTSWALERSAHWLWA
jgi:hypothetical protein